MKNKETLEEAFDRIFDSIDYILFDYTSFEQGAKWQQERSYSEEEVLKFSEWFAYELKHYDYPTEENIVKALKEIKRIIRTI